MRFVLACPAGYGFDDKFKVEYVAKVNSSLPEEINDPFAAVKGADVIYTDVWTSMGQEAEREERLKRFAPFQVNAATAGEGRRRSARCCTACRRTAARRSPTT